MTPIEISREVAERIMGWRINSGLPVYTDREGKAVSLVAKWNPAADIRAALQVAMAMRDKGYHFLLMLSPDSGNAIASFYIGPKDRTDYCAGEPVERAALAICRAALNRVEITQ